MKPLLGLLCALILTVGVSAQTGREWDFADEEEVTASGLMIRREQAADLTAISGFIALAFVSFFRKDERLKIVVLSQPSPTWGSTRVNCCRSSTCSACWGPDSRYSGPRSDGTCWRSSAWPPPCCGVACIAGESVPSGR